MVAALPAAGRPPRDHVVFVCDTTELAVAAPDIVDPDRWREEFEDLTGRLGVRIARVETRHTAAKMLAGMVSELPSKNCWSLAEHAGDRSPDAMQHLLSTAVVDDTGLRDDLRNYVIEHLPVLQPGPGHPRPAGQSRRPQMVNRRELPNRQDTDRPGRAPGPPLGLLAPLDIAGHTRPRVPHRPRHQPTRNHTDPRWPDLIHPQRNSTSNRSPTRPLTKASAK